MIGLGAKKLRETLPPRGATIGEGTALNRDPEAKPAPIIVPDSDREGHIFTMGATRSGKTRLAEVMIEHDIRAGRSILWIDPKGDNGIFSKIVTVARETGREDDLLFFSPVFPRYGVSRLVFQARGAFCRRRGVSHLHRPVRLRRSMQYQRDGVPAKRDIINLPGTAGSLHGEAEQCGVLILVECFIENQVEQYPDHSGTLKNRGRFVVGKSRRRAPKKRHQQKQNQGAG